MMNDNPMPPKVPEVLAPAGGPESLQAAVRAGADAVYLGRLHSAPVPMQRILTGKRSKRPCTIVMRAA